MIGRSFALYLAAFAASAVNAQAPVPEPSIDIGTVGFPGNATGGGTEWTVVGSGGDIWSTGDHFHYLHFNRTTDVTVTMMVEEFTQPRHNSWRKGGIMFRSHTGYRSPHSMIQQTGWGVAHQGRNGEAHGSWSVHDSYSTGNTWLRLVKEGNTITSYVKKDGEFGFLRYHSHEVDLGAEFLIGIAVTSHDNSQVATLKVRDFEISDEVLNLDVSASEVGDTGTDGRVWIQEVGEGLWSIEAAGAGIGGGEDALGFFDQEQTGDITATLHLEKLQRINGETKGGLMMRATKDTNSPHVSLLTKSDTGVTLFWRETIGGETHSHNVGVWEEDVELRLVKVGNVITASYKHSAATEWYVLGTATVDLGASYFVGPAVSSAHHGTRTKLVVGELVVA